ncbi:Hypothetical predicted protein [Mytilus galloprovincialis]|uniref:Uncharacterized protein n=1 Tax=Mytilus galloprovincialis TaxID=29158 RepID=A0A8B6EQB0_MYTGA|nr:Hypothetical predicted protein [Mytilus galloprovincialis]
MPELQANTKGRDALLVFEKDIGSAMATIQFEESSSRNKNSDDRHHDNSMSMQQDFIDNVRSLKAVMNDYGNPFLEDTTVKILYKQTQRNSHKFNKCNQYADYRIRM